MTHPIFAISNGYTSKSNKWSRFQLQFSWWMGCWFFLRYRKKQISEKRGWVPVVKIFFLFQYSIDKVECIMVPFGAATEAATCSAASALLHRHYSKFWTPPKFREGGAINFFWYRTLLEHITKPYTCGQLFPYIPVSMRCQTSHARTHAGTHWQ